MKRQASISLRLTIWFGVFFFLGWLLFGTAMWLNLSRTLRNERHQTLARRVDRLQELLLKDQSAKDDDRYQDFADFAHATGNGLSEIFLPDGHRAFPSPSAAATAFSWPQIKAGDSERFIHVQSAGQPYWVLVRPFSFDGQPLFLLAAAPESGNILILQQFWTALLASIPILILLSSAAGYWISSRALAPVDRITATCPRLSPATYT